MGLNIADIGKHYLPMDKIRSFFVLGQHELSSLYTGSVKGANAHIHSDVSSVTHAFSTGEAVVLSPTSAMLWSKFNDLFVTVLDQPDNAELEACATVIADIGCYLGPKILDSIEDKNEAIIDDIDKVDDSEKQMQLDSITADKMEMSSDRSFAALLLKTKESPPFEINNQYSCPESQMFHGI